MHILLHPRESGCQKKTFLCAVVAQMFHEVIPTEAEVRGQPAGSIKLLSSPWLGYRKDMGKYLESRLFSSAVL